MARTRKKDGGERVAIVVFYRPLTGAIVHAHQATVDAGSALPDRRTLERQAIEFVVRIVVWIEQNTSTRPGLSKVTCLVFSLYRPRSNSLASDMENAL